MSETSDDDLELMRETLGCLGLELAGEPAPIASGRNHNWRVETSAGPLFFRRHRHTRPLERIELGLAALAHAAAKGVPVALPLASSNGTVLFGGPGRFGSVYQWVEASTYERGAITPEQGGVFGTMHGHLHLALHDFEHAALEPSTELAWDTAGSLADLVRIRAVVTESEDPEEPERTDVLAAIDEQMPLLERGTLPGPGAFESMDRQAIHGDVHEGNVMLHPDDSIAAVVDWDMVASGPRLYEVIRALDFTYALDNEGTLAGYLSAYAQVAPYTAAEAGQAVELWASSVIHNTWALRARFLEGDRRVEPFIGAHRKRVREYSDAGYLRWLAGHFREFASG
ncbi:MAG: phosphotransferase [Dehalococcoidia bacterium]